MKRREFIAFVGSNAIVVSREAIAQTTRSYHLGTLTVSAPISSGDGAGAVLIAGLAQRGYVLGHNLTYDARGAATMLADA